MTSRSILVSADKKTDEGSVNVTPDNMAACRSRACATASAAASWTRSFMPTSSAGSARAYVGIMPASTPSSTMSVR